MTKSFLAVFSLGITLGTMVACTNDATVKSASSAEFKNGGYESPEIWGEHLVTIAGCNDCHSPKVMTAHGPDIDSSRMLSGHPSQDPDPAVDRKALESKGIAATDKLTAWTGPWGVSYSANLTSDSTGIGAWSEGQFIYSLRNGKYKGLPEGRNLLPPMPWQTIRHMTDDELKAVFAYLKSTKAIRNLVPGPKPPTSVQPQ